MVVLILFFIIFLTLTRRTLIRLRKWRVTVIILIIIKLLNFGVMNILILSIGAKYVVRVVPLLIIKTVKGRLTVVLIRVKGLIKRVKVLVNRFSVAGRNRPFLFKIVVTSPRLFMRLPLNGAKTLNIVITSGSLSLTGGAVMLSLIRRMIGVLLPARKSTVVLSSPRRCRCFRRVGNTVIFLNWAALKFDLMIFLLSFKIGLIG